MESALNDLLSVNADEVKPLPVHPAGWFVFDVASFSFGESAKKKTPLVEYTLAGGEPFESVDSAEWEEYSSDQASDMRTQFYITPAALIRLTSFLKDTGVDLTGRQLRECIPDAVGHKVLVEVVHSYGDRNGETVTYANAERFKRYD